MSYLAKQRNVMVVVEGLCSW